MNSLGEFFGNAEPLVYKGDSKWVLDTCTVGIEMEVENLRARNHQAPHQDRVQYDIGGMWALVSDGSLRNNGGEYISRKLFGKDLTTGLEILDHHLKTVEPQHTFSHRCSVHVHLDVRDLSIQQFQHFLQLYCIFERPLFRFSGERQNNEYCIPVSTSGEAKRLYAKLASTKGQYAKAFQIASKDRAFWEDIRQSIAGEYVKYMALNLLPFVTKGSVEFRHHEGTANMERITAWLNMLFCLKKAALNYPYKKDPYLQLSSMGPLAMASLVFGDLSKDFQYDNFEVDLWHGCRAAQDMLLHFDLVAVNSKLFKSALNKDMIKTLEAPPIPKALGGDQPAVSQWVIESHQEWQRQTGNRVREPQLRNRVPEQTRYQILGDANLNERARQHAQIMAENMHMNAQLRPPIPEPAHQGLNPAEFVGVGGGGVAADPAYRPAMRVARIVIDDVQGENE